MAFQEFSEKSVGNKIFFIFHFLYYQIYIYTESKKMISISLTILTIVLNQCVEAFQYPKFLCSFPQFQ